MLDVGTGSGILAIAAARAGARRVYAVEAGDIADVGEWVFTANRRPARLAATSTMNPWAQRWPRASCRD